MSNEVQTILEKRAEKRLNAADNDDRIDKALRSMGWDFELLKPLDEYDAITISANTLRSLAEMVAAARKS